MKLVDYQIIGLGIWTLLMILLVVVVADNGNYGGRTTANKVGCVVLTVIVVSLACVLERSSL